MTQKQNRLRMTAQMCFTIRVCWAPVDVGSSSIPPPSGRPFHTAEDGHLKAVFPRASLKPGFWMRIWFHQIEALTQD